MPGAFFGNALLLITQPPKSQHSPKSKTQIHRYRELHPNDDCNTHQESYPASLITRQAGSHT